MAMFEETLIWDDNPGPVSGSTPYGIYDSDSRFQNDAPKFAKWATRRLGYPIVEIELTSGSLYACYEEAIGDYTLQINQFLIRENLLNAKGMSTNIKLNQRNLLGIGLNQVIRVAHTYAAEVGAGGNVTWHSASIDIHANEQDYDLDAWASVNIGVDKPIEVKRIHHYGRPAVSRYYDPFIETGLARNNLMGEFGWAGWTPAIEYVLFPIYEDLLRVQAVELNDQIRRSAYSFEIINNKLRIFPRPSADFKLWIQYIVVEERDNAMIQPNSGSTLAQTLSSTTSNIQSDFSNIQYNFLEYSKINETGIQWIRKYGLACAKETLGLVRSKYQQIPIPDAEITLDGETLRNESQAEKEVLITQLRETLEEASRTRQYERMVTENEAIENVLKRVPLKIYIG